MKLKLKKAFALLLAVCLIALCAPMAALAEDDPEIPVTGKALQLLQNATAANMPGEQKSNIWFGNYVQSSDGNGGFNIDPIKWRVLDNQQGEMFLLSDRCLDHMPYHRPNIAVTWESSLMRHWLNGYGGNVFDTSFIESAFSAGEIAAIKDTELSNYNPYSSAPGGNNTTDKIFLLSISEVRNYYWYGFEYDTTPSDTRIAVDTDYAAAGGTAEDVGDFGPGEPNWWWLRSPGSEANRAAVVRETGAIAAGGYWVIYSTEGVRPALKLDQNAVLFASSAAGGKQGEGALTEIADYSGNEWKVTVLDSSRHFSVDETSALFIPGETVTLHYDNATVGDNEYVSAILADENGNALYYGKLAQSETAAGAVTISVPTVLSSGTYTLKMFSEKCNDDYQTDFASAFCNISVTVDAQPYLDRLEAFDACKNLYQDIVDMLARPDDSDACTALIAAAKDAIDDLSYDISKTLDENRADVTAVLLQLSSDLTAQREMDAAAQYEEDLWAFNAFKTSQKVVVSAMAQPGDSDACAALISAGKAAVEALDYDKSKTLAENMLDVSAIITQLISNLATQRTADAEAQLAADTAAADAVEAKIDDIGEVAYSDESKEKIDEARAAYNALTAAQKELVSNYETLTAAESRYAELKAAAETPDTPDDPTEPEQPTEPAGPDQPQTEDLCKWCGEPHTGFWGKIVGFWHTIFYFWAHLFRLK